MMSTSLRTTAAIPQEFSLSQLAQYFHLPINVASEELGVCATVLKKVCRLNNVDRWPYRKFASIDSLIRSLEVAVKEDSSLQKELDSLHQRRLFLLQNPNADYKTVVSKQYINALSKFTKTIPRTGTMPSRMERGATKTIVKSKGTSPVKTNKNFMKLPSILHPDITLNQSEDKAVKALLHLKFLESFGNIHMKEENQNQNQNISFLRTSSEQLAF